MHAHSHHFALALLEAFAIECSFKKWMNLVGKQRPDWLVRLASGDQEKIREGRTSYPSGHAAETTMTFGLLTFYLLARLKLFTRQSPVRKYMGGQGGKTSCRMLVSSPPLLSCTASPLID